MAFFDATKEFDTALSEIDNLIFAAQEEIPESRRFSTNLKAATVLLASKLEAYVENIVEEYVDKISVCKPKAKHLPISLRDYSTVHLIDKINSNGKFSSKYSNVNYLLAASNLWSEEEILEKVVVNGKFNYGKHGSTELENLFNRAGIQDIYNICKVTEDDAESMLSINTTKSISGDIDSLTNIRNNIIHSDASPNFTVGDIERYKNKIWEFCYQIDLLLDRELCALKARMLANP